MIRSTHRLLNLLVAQYQNMKLDQYDDVSYQRVSNLQ